MSVNSLFETRRKGFILRTVTLSDATYTVKVGRPADAYIHDRIIDVAVCPCEIEVPDGVYEGQRLLLRCSATTIIGIVDIDTDTGDDIDLNDTDEYVSLEWVNSTSGWQTLASNP